MISMPNRRSNSAGFTLVELLITLVISGIIAGALYSTYLVQQRSYTNQEAVAEMQQNIRAALMVMSRDIRMAGYDPVGSAGTGFDDVQKDALAFSADLSGDGDKLDAGENIAYDLYQSPTTGLSTIGRTSSNSTVVLKDMGGGHFEVDSTASGLAHQPLAENIERLEFQYLDGNGAVTTVPANIRAVRVSVLARASRPDRKFTNTKVYTPASGVPWDLNGAAAGNAANDNFRRRLLITTIQCRNMGL